MDQKQWQDDVDVDMTVELTTRLCEILQCPGKAPTRTISLLEAPTLAVSRLRISLDTMLKVLVGSKEKDLVEAFSEHFAKSR